MIPVFHEAELRAVMTPERAVAAMREAFRADGEGRAHVPPVINLEIPAARGEFHVKTAHIEGVPYIAVKIASGFYDNPAKGLPSGSGLMAIFDAATGLPVALLLDNGFLTDVRTGAAGALAADYLARRDDHHRRRHRVRRPGAAPGPLPPHRPQLRADRRLEPEPHPPGCVLHRDGV